MGVGHPVSVFRFSGIPYSGIPKETVVANHFNSANRKFRDQITINNKNSVMVRSQIIESQADLRMQAQVKGACIESLGIVRAFHAMWMS
jgi:hypothetical protein